MKGSPVLPGGSLESKPTWWTIFEWSTTSAFLLSMARGRPQSPERRPMPLSGASCCRDDKVDVGDQIKVQLTSLNKCARIYRCCLLRQTKCRLARCGRGEGDQRSYPDRKNHPMHMKLPVNLPVITERLGRLMSWRTLRNGDGRPPKDEPPFRGELFSVDQLERHAKALAT